MQKNRTVSYRENQIQAASPSTLARIALEESIKSIRTAIEQTKTQGHQARGESLSRAMNLLSEFAAILNESADPELVRNLKELTGYCHNQLLKAHIEQSEPLMAGVIQVLQPIVEAWITVERREIHQSAVLNRTA